MNVYAILSNDNVTKLSTMLESITGAAVKVRAYTDNRAYEEEDTRLAKMIDISNGLQDLQMTLCDVLTLEMNEAVADEVQKEMEREAAYEAERKAKEGL